MIRRISLAVMLLLAACARDETESSLPPLRELAADSLQLERLSLSPDGRMVAWWEFDGSGFDLWVADSDLSMPRRVRVRSGDQSPPLWSPDGTRLATAAVSDSGSVLAIVSATDGAVESVPIGPQFFVTSWHREGQRVLYSRLLEGGAFRAEVMDLVTRTSRPILPAGSPPHFAIYSPTSETIVIGLIEGPRTTLAALDSIGSALRPLTTEGFEAFGATRQPWSPDGTQLLFESTRTGAEDLWVVEVATGTLRQLTNDIRRDWGAVWSPDGRQIAFLSERGRQPDVWVMPAAGGDPVRVTESRAEEELIGWRDGGTGLLIATDLSQGYLHALDLRSGDDRSLLPDSLNLTYFRRSPDNQLVAIVARGVGSAFHVYVLRPDGAGLRKLASFSGPSPVLRWSPDSRQLATLANDGGSPDPWVVDVETGATRQLVDWGGWEGDVEFAPDGRSVLIVSDHESSFNDIWRVPLDSTAPVRMTRTGTPIGAPWPTAGRLVVPVFGGTAGRISLGEVLPTGGIRTIWDRSSIQSSAVDMANIGDSILVSGPDDDGRARSRMIALADGGARLVGEPDDRVTAMARAGRWVVFSTGGQRGSRVGVLHLDTGERRILTDGLTNASGAEFLADSTVIAYRRSVRQRKPAVADVSKLVEAQ